jgi:hypothetical protein
MAASVVAGAAILGVAATLAMDLWNLFLKRAFAIPSLDLCLLGRWLRHMPEGHFRHRSIGAAAPRRFECALGRVAHYSIGVVLALGFLALAPEGWLARPTLAPALAYGVATLVFPYFLMQPAFGLGVAASRAAAPGKARLKSLASHVVFGVGLYLAALAVGHAV